MSWTSVGCKFKGEGTVNINGLRRVCGWCVLGTHGFLMAGGREEGAGCSEGTRVWQTGSWR